MLKLPKQISSNATITTKPNSKKVKEKFLKALEFGDKDTINDIIFETSVLVYMSKDFDIVAKIKEKFSDVDQEIFFKNIWTQVSSQEKLLSPTPSEQAELLRFQLLCSTTLKEVRAKINSQSSEAQQQESAAAQVTVVEKPLSTKEEKKEDKQTETLSPEFAAMGAFRDSGDVKKFTNSIHEGKMIKFALYPKILDVIKEKTTPKQAQELYDLFISRINSGVESPALEIFKANCLFAKGRLIIEQYSEEKSRDIKMEKYTEALTLCDEANILFINNEFERLSPKVLEYISEQIKNYNDPQNAYILAKASLDIRKQHLEENTKTTLAALTSAAQAGLKIISPEDINIATEVHILCTRALNICTNLNLNSARIPLYEAMNTLHKDILGDQNKATIMAKLATAYREGNFQDGDKFSFNPVIKFGSIMEDVLETELKIKKAIQESILDKVYTQAQNGKWYEVQYGIEYGISGYITEDNIKKYIAPLGLDEEAHINTALKLCFESINLGIMHSSMKNPLCAAIFTQQHPKLTKEILATRPEFFVDEYILKTSAMPNSAISLDIVGKNSMVEIDSYNKHFEKAILPFLHSRLDEVLYNPLMELITAKNWNNATALQLKHLLSEEYLTSTGISGLSNSYLGRNLGEIKDIFNIIRVEAFKTAMEALIQNNDGNYGPLAVYLEVIKESGIELLYRINENHPKYFDATTVANMFEKCFDLFVESTDTSNEKIAEKKPAFFGSLLSLPEDSVSVSSEIASAKASSINESESMPLSGASLNPVDGAGIE